jgi:septum formation protein
VPNIILASSSPRRTELLKRIGVEDFRVIPHGCGEDTDAGLPPEDVVSQLSRRKAERIARRHAIPGDVVVAADTVVWYDGQVLGKPEDERDAFDTLTKLSGNWHQVYTGITVIRNEQILTEMENTSVLMRRMTPEEIWSYIATGEPMDKAGAYGIQERGALLCERVDGDFYNVMGLPLFRLGLMLRQVGVNLLSEDHLGR